MLNTGGFSIGDELQTKKPNGTGYFIFFKNFILFILF
jgi:hypothetical protein